MTQQNLNFYLALNYRIEIKPLSADDGGGGSQNTLS